MHIAKLLGVGLLFGISAASPAIATPFSIAFSGTVNVAISNTGGPLPPGIQDGATVTGLISFDTADAQSPIYTGLGGGGIAASFAFSTGMHQELHVGGTMLEVDSGEINLVQSGFGSEAISIDSNVTGLFSPPAELTFVLGQIVPSDPVFPDINTLAGIDFADFDVLGGTIETGPDGYYFTFIPAPEPGSIALLGVALSLTALGRRRTR